MENSYDVIAGSDQHAVIEIRLSRPIDAIAGEIIERRAIHLGRRRFQCSSATPVPVTSSHRDGNGALTVLMAVHPHSDRDRS